MLTGLIIGFVAGVVVMIIVSQITATGFKKKDEERNEQMKETFQALSATVLRETTTDFFKLAESTLNSQTKLNAKELETKKGLIDQSLKVMDEDLKKVGKLVQDIEKDRATKFGALDTQLKNATEQTEKLRITADQLRNALTNNQARGQWGQRMAEDVLKLAGFVEGINYFQQKKLETSAKKPDFTFPLPQNLKVNMDAKFSFNNYLKYLEATSDGEKEKAKLQFLKDVKDRIKEVQNKDYINPEENTLDYMIIFIPNEQIYCFIHENDPTIIDDAMRQKVIITSPFTLYAVLAVIRQAVENFNVEKTAGQIFSYLQKFREEWVKYKEEMNKIGDKLNSAKETFDSLMTTRTNKLERPLEKIDELKNQRSELALETKAEIIAQKLL